VQRGLGDFDLPLGHRGELVMEHIDEVDFDDIDVLGQLVPAHGLEAGVYGIYPVAALRPSAVDEDQRPVHAATVSLGAHPITGACAEMDGSPRPSYGPELSPLPVGITSCSPHNWGLGPLSSPVVG